VKLARHSPLLFSLFNYRGQSSRFTYPPADAGGTDTPSLTVGLRPRIRRRYLCAVTGAFAILADTVSVVTSPSPLQTLAPPGQTLMFPLQGLAMSAQTLVALGRAVIAPPQTVAIHGEASAARGQTPALRSEALATRSRTATARQEALVTRYQSSFRSPAKAGLSR